MLHLVYEVNQKGTLDFGNQVNKRISEARCATKRTIVGLDNKSIREVGHFYERIRCRMVPSQGAICCSWIFPVLPFPFEPVRIR
jgi:hypothetical protein